MASSADEGGPTHFVQHISALGGFANCVIGADLHVFGDGSPLYRLSHRPPAPAPHETVGLPDQPSRLLNTRSAVVDFTGRESELESLCRWRDDSRHHWAARWLSAPGGTGKSRLAAEFGLLSSASNWKVVTVVHGRGTVLPPEDSVDLRLKEADGVLLVVDYADRWPLSHLAWLFSNVLLHQTVPTRLLLVARSAAAWAPVRALLGDQDMACDAQPLSPLPSQRGPGGREQMFTVARDCFAARYGLSDASVIPCPGNLAEPEFGLVLALHMAALVAVDAHLRDVLPPEGVAALSSYLLDRERLHWARLYGNHADGLPFRTPPEVMARVVFAACLTGPSSRVRAKELLHRLDLEVHPDRVLDDHARCYPPEDGATVLEPMYPDRLAEDFIALSLPGHEAGIGHADPAAGETLALLLSRGPDDEAPAHLARTLTVLASAAAPGRWTHVGPHLDGALAVDPGLALLGGGAALAAVARVPSVSEDTLTAVGRTIPDEENIDLRLGIAVLTQRLTAHQLQYVRSARQYAQLHHLLARRLRDAGFRNDALAAQRTAEAAWRYQARTDPAAHEPLAESLLALGYSLVETGRHTEALAAYEEALAVLGPLDGRGPDRDLLVGMVLGNCATAKAALGQAADALAMTRESLRIIRAVVSEVPEAEHHLSVSLGNLANRLAEAGHLGDALDALSEEVTVRRRMGIESSTENRVGYALAVANLSVRLGEFGRTGEALVRAEEAVELLGPMAARSPRAFEPALCHALVNLGAARLKLGDRDAALADVADAVRRLEPLHIEEPGAHDELYAQALATLARLLTGAEAADTARRAVAYHRELAAERPRQFEGKLAEVLRTLASIPEPDVSADESLRSLEEATDIFRVLYASDTGGFAAQLTNSLGWLRACHHDEGRVDQARACASEMVTLCRALATSDPREFALVDQALYASCLGELAAVFTGQEEEIAAAEDHVAVRRRRLAEGGTESAVREEEKSLAGALMLHTLQLGDAARFDEAVLPCREAVAVYRRLEDPTPLVPALAELSLLLVNVGQTEEGIAAAREAVGLLRALDSPAHPGDAAVSPTPSKDHHAGMYRTLAGVLQSAGRTSEALDAAARSVSLFRRSGIVGDEVYADAVTRLAELLNDAERHPEAIEAAHEAAERWRGLPLENSNAASRRLAALHLLKSLLASQGQATELPDVSAEIVVVLRELVEGEPAEFEWQLALQLCEYATILGEAGRRQEALTPMREGVAVLQRLIDDGVPGLEHSAGQALLNLGSYLSRTGETEDAIRAAEVTVAFLRRQTIMDVGHERTLALALNNLGAFLGVVDREAEALEAVREALLLFRAHQNATSTDDAKTLASILENLAHRLQASGEKDKELAVREELVDLCRDLVTSTEAPDDVARLGAALQGLTRIRSELLRWSQAAAVAEEWTRRARRSAPDTLDLALALMQYGACLAYDGRGSEAVGPLGEAVRILQALTDQGDSQACTALDTVLTWLADFCEEEGDWPAVLEYATRAAELQRGRPDFASMEAQHSLADALGSLQGAFTALGRHEEAVQTAREAVSARRASAEADTEAHGDGGTETDVPGHRTRLAVALFRLGQCCRATGDLLEGLTAMQEAADLFECLPADRATVFAAEALTTIDEFLLRLNWLDQTQVPAEAAVRLYRDLAAADPDRHLPDLAEALVNHGLRLSYVARFDEAVSAVEEGIALTARLAQADPQSIDCQANFSRALFASAWIRVEGDRELDMALSHVSESLETAVRLHAHDPRKYADLLEAGSGLRSRLIGKG
ncbi:hypothetical protein ACIPSJ_50025 [Streptomyces sp. NPDC090088]|uniref:hypothetical protein n=1 Tax=Streptomyces sp. NPDC090088 TaxID=3365944 RepID=UPI0037FEB1FE